MSFLNTLSSDCYAVVIMLLIAGLVLVLIGSEALVDGASNLAKKLGISDFVIGLSIVAIGTSTPEMIVSFVGAFQGNADISIGNILGSNVFNTSFVLGLSALIAPVAITRSNKLRDVPVNLGITLLFTLCCMAGPILGLMGYDQSLAPSKITRIGGLVFLLLFAGYMTWTFLSTEKSEEDKCDKSKSSEISILMSLIFVLLGIVSLVFGGQVFVSSAEAIAQKAGLSDKFIAVTVLACGTSLPELVTSAIAASKGKGQLAIGNVIGSNVTNILLIVGGSAVISPLSISNVDWWDTSALLISAVVLMIFTSLRKDKLNRSVGIILLALGLGYLGYNIFSII